MTLTLYNTLTRKYELFVPLSATNIGMYVCGPTVYDKPHIGNARAVVVYDILYRVLCDIYGSKNVTYVRNITDVDDKINHAAREANITIKQLTSNITRIFHSNMDQLNCLRPNIEPYATDHINEMVAMIEQLLTHKAAYIANNHVYFDVTTYPNYGTLAGKDLSKLKAGSRIEIEPHKRHAEDFVLWKPAAEDEEIGASFESPWGIGRPGWHIECSAMSIKYLGAEFDIHGGGVDLVFPHHVNEVAQSCCAYPGSNFARFWVHNGFVKVKGEKMSKSLGNFITVQELLDQNIPGEVIRYLLLATHYRKPLNWQTIDNAMDILDSLYRALEKANYDGPPQRDEVFIEILHNDLNTSQAFSHMTMLAKQIHKNTAPQILHQFAAKLKFCGEFLGFFTIKNWAERSLLPAEQEKLRQRQKARAEKNWALADQLRRELYEAGLIIEDLSDGNYVVRKASPPSP